MTADQAIAHFGDQGWANILWPVISQNEFDQHIASMYGNIPFDKLNMQRKYQEGSHYRTLPSYGDLFKAFRWCEPNYFKVLIIGQDPYPNPENASGVAFGVPDDQTRIPKSLLNLCYELERTYTILTLGIDITLFSWAWQGVLLINAGMTLKEKSGDQFTQWQPWSSQMIDHILYHYPGTPVITFGTKARDTLSDYAKGLCEHIHSDHPSAANYGRSNGAIGTDCFLKANQNLERRGLRPIDWIGDKRLEAAIEAGQEPPF